MMMMSQLTLVRDDLVLWHGRGKTCLTGSTKDIGNYMRALKN